MRKKILVAGPSYVDHCINLKCIISLDGSSAINEEKKYTGGTGFCYGLSLSRLGNKVSLHSIIGNDIHSEFIESNLLKERGLKTFFQKGKEGTDHAYVLIDNGNHKIVASKKVISNRWSPGHEFQDHLKKSDALVISSFSNHIVKKILASLKKLDGRKPFVMWAPHLQNCSEAKTLTDHLELIDHLTLSKEEYERLIIKIGNPIGLGIKSVTVTSGKNGCDLLTQKINKHFEAFKKVQNPIDTNGAGEAFGSGFLTSFLLTNNYNTSVLIGQYIAYLHIHRKANNFPKINVYYLLGKMKIDSFQIKSELSKFHNLAYG